MKKKTKIYLSLSATIASVVPIATVLSCGSQNNNYQQNNSQQDNNLDKNNGNLTDPCVYTKEFFANVQSTITFSGAQGSVTPKDNEILNVGIPYATLKYGWSLDDVKEPLVYVADYHQVKSMNYGYTFWIVVTPKAGVPMGKGQPTTFKTKVEHAVVTFDFFNSVKSTLNFVKESDGFVSIDDNVTLNAGLANATLKYGWTYDPISLPVAYVTDYHQLKDMKEKYTFWIVVTPNEDAQMGYGQKTTLSVPIKNAGSSTQQKLDAITKEMVTNTISAILMPDSSKHVPSAPTGDKFTNVSIGGVNGAYITISRWIDDLKGAAEFSIISINKDNAVVKGDKFGTIKVSGFQSTTFKSIPGLVTKTINAFSFISNKYFAATNKGLSISYDGVAFSQVAGIASNCIVNSVYQASNGRIFAGTWDGLEVSTNQGFDFTKVAGLPNNNIGPIFQDSYGSIFIGVQDQGLWVSIDGGNTFKPVNGNIGSTWLSITSIYQATNGTIFVGTFGALASGLWFSLDGVNFYNFNRGLGNNWEINSIYQTTNGNIYVGTISHGLWVSIDGGNHFTQDTFLKNNWNINSIYQAPDGKIFVGTDSEGLWMSVDGGASFIQVGGGLGNNFNIQAIYQTPTGKIFVGTNGNSIFTSN